MSQSKGNLAEPSRRPPGTCRGTTTVKHIAFQARAELDVRASPRQGRVLELAGRPCHDSWGFVLDVASGHPPR
jgi:hypothetical protein